MTKEDKKWKRKFIAFLKENGIYEKWIYNIKDQHPMSNDAWWDYFKDSIYENKYYDGINHAFTWADTKDGHEYWKYFDLKWKSKRKYILECNDKGRN